MQADISIPKNLDVIKLLLILKRMEVELKNLKYYSPVNNNHLPDYKLSSVHRLRECIDDLDNNFKDFGY